jgi:hypothetical protein
VSLLLRGLTPRPRANDPQALTNTATKETGVKAQEARELVPPVRRDSIVRRRL